MKCDWWFTVSTATVMRSDVLISLEMLVVVFWVVSSGCLTGGY
jgi:hypothetical protein